MTPEHNQTMKLTVAYHQNGFSLVEMMIAMLIGLFLMGGVISVYMSSAQSSRINEELRNLQENGRFALNSIKNSIQMAGYIDSYDPSALVNPFPAASNSSLTARFEAPADCTGTTTAGLAPPDTGVAENTLSVNAAGELICTGNAGGAGAPITIIEGVEQMRILYGLDDDGDGDTDRYLTAAAVNATGLPNVWRDNINSIRIGLLLRSDRDLKPANENKNYQLLDIQVAKNDRKLYKTFSTTILIRNRMS